MMKTRDGMMKTKKRRVSLPMGMEKRRVGSRRGANEGRRNAGWEDTWSGVAGVARWLEEVERSERGMPGSGSFMARMWPMFLLAIVLGVAFDVVKLVVVDVRRRLYNKNRNRKYAEERRSGDKGARKNMAWRMEAAGKVKGGAPLPLPPGFVEGVCRQWDKVHDSTEEAIRFGEMMIELEGYVDNSFIFGDEGEIVSRHPGIKGFMAMNCPHIGYGPTLRYRILAMKVREVVRRQGKIPAQCRTVYELEEKINACLGVGRRRLGQPRRKCRRPRRDCSPQPVIFSIREAVRSAGKLDVPRRRRVVDALQEVERELTV